MRSASAAARLVDLEVRQAARGGRRRRHVARANGARAVVRACAEALAAPSLTQGSTQRMRAFIGEPRDAEGNQAPCAYCDRAARFSVQGEPRCSFHLLETPPRSAQREAAARRREGTR